MSWLAIAGTVLGIILFLIWAVAISNNKDFRLISKDIWVIYFLGLLRDGWPAALILALYTSLHDGSLSALLR